jgi:hydroxyacylglutathione hydrolase
MSLEISTFILGPFKNNTYLVADTQEGAAVVIDPSFGCTSLLEYVGKRGWSIQEIWLTHAHFDHFAGTGNITSTFEPAPPVRLHPLDLDLWRKGGNAQNFGKIFNPGPEPLLEFVDNQKLMIGQTEFEVRFAPGHTRGHVIIYCPSANALFCGDVIFKGGIGRTDLAGGDYEALLNSIRNRVLTLPDETRLLSGHGPESTVGEEKQNNPFLD